MAETKEVTALVTAMQEVRELATWHYDPDADPDDASPEDAAAWQNGIIVQKIDAALAAYRAAQGETCATCSRLAAFRNSCANFLDELRVFPVDDLPPQSPPGCSDPQLKPVCETCGGITGGGKEWFPCPACKGTGRAT